jgi:excisionase family DNA binding protein
MREYLTPAEVAERIRYTRSGVYRLIERGTIRAVRVGNSPRAPLRVRADELERALTPCAAREAGRPLQDPATSEPGGPHPLDERPNDDE